MTWPLAVALSGALLLGGCTGATDGPAGPAMTMGRPGVASPSAPPDPPVATPPRVEAPAPEPARFDRDAAYAVVERLAGGIGPREATSAEYRTAARWVARRLQALGYAVERQRVRVPAGVSWGVRVPAGATQNVVATPPGFRPDQPHRLIGAHLDTVPQAPGAEDNASGVGVLLELARIAAGQPPEVPVVLVAFGGEEPRGPGDALHHFGSQRMVATMPDEQRDALLGMLALDRVGVRAARVPVCHGGLGSDEVREQLVAAARRADVRVRRCENRASDHWSFEKAGVPAGRLGSVPYPAYHTRLDLPDVVDPVQLGRTGRIALAWMRSAEERPVP